MVHHTLSEIKHGHQQSFIFFVNYLAQSCVGSRQRNDVTRSIFCPNFCKLVTSILDLDLMNLSLKTCAWFNPIIQGKEILTGNTSTTSDRDEWFRLTYAMHGKCNHEIDMRCPKSHHFLVNHALGTMFTWFSIIF